MEKKYRLLIVEDEESILQGLIDVFVYHGYQVDSETDGQKGLERARRGNYDLILLDVMLPSLDGFSICEELRKESREQPIIMLTAKTTEDDIINGLRLGADDYVAKPFSVTELVLRVEAVMRRAKGAFEGIGAIQVGDRLSIDTVNLSAMSKEGESEELVFTRREVQILLYLLKHADRPVGRGELLMEVWGYKKGALIETRTVDIHVAKLRRKIECDPKEPEHLVTVRGEGYRLLGCEGREL